MKIIKIILLVIAVGLLAVIALNSFNRDGEPFIQLGGASSPYKATSSPESLPNISYSIKGGFGTLGSVLITATGDMGFDLLNATTTDINLRALATSSILIASFPASPTVGDYSFDVAFTDGLYFDVTSGTIGSTTITFD